jgi:lipopolysaccharide/colanic/teichoic acid biosynthesis glycosyltransferase
MSLVGPRPILIEERELVDPLHRERFDAKPGLTGLWQVTGRKEVAWEDRMLRDLAYIENWSLWRDLVYIAKTFRAVIKGQGAY